MNVELAILDLSERGVQVALGEGVPFWLPRSAPGIVWSAQPEIGDVVFVRLPHWIVAKHQQLKSLQYQRSLSFAAPVELNSKGSLPMAYDNNLSGALFKNNKRETEKHPLYKGSCEINGRKYWISAWLKTSERTGEKYMSLAFKPAEEQRQEQRPPESQSYAAARGRDEPQQQPERGGPDWDSQIPFSAETR